ncbi:hypothetical protein H4R34_001543 [Dimargaris verticillata]|uniref:Symplekin tight junction protein C terminal-domain-containing protein n=1 Tax=Dimargaris verticillata TaxID=2761393 RepID=A0A9W8B491_9FUNG|nr:hypothetical protein H4R34_001543 [Dimargaris verticillata]
MADDTTSHLSADVDHALQALGETANAPTNGPEARYSFLIDVLGHRSPLDAKPYEGLVLALCQQAVPAKTQLAGLRILEACLDDPAAMPRQDHAYHAQFATRAASLLRLCQPHLAQEKSGMVLGLRVLARLYPLVFYSACQFAEPSQAEAWRLINALCDEVAYMLEIPDNALFLGALRLYYARIETLSAPDDRVPDKVNLNATTSNSSTHVRPISQRRHTLPNLSSCPPNHPFLQPKALQMQGKEYLDHTILTLQHPHMSGGAISALIALSTAYLRTHPDALPLVLHQFAAWYREPIQKFTTFQWKCLCKTLRLNWLTLYKVLHQTSLRVLGTDRPIAESESPFPLDLLSQQLQDLGARRELDSYIARYARLLQQQRQYSALTQSRAEPAPKPARAETRTEPPIPPFMPSATPAGLASGALDGVLQKFLSANPGFSPQNLQQLIQQLPPPLVAAQRASPLKRGRDSDDDDVSASARLAPPESSLVESKRTRLSAIEPQYEPVDSHGDGNAEDDDEALAQSESLELVGDDAETMLEAALVRILDASDDLVAATYVKTLPLDAARAASIPPHTLDYPISRPSQSILLDYMVFTARLATLLVQMHSNFVNDLTDAPGMTVVQRELGRWLTNAYASVCPRSTAVAKTMSMVDSHGKALVKFVLDIPSVPAKCVELLKDHYPDSPRSSRTLANLVELRPPVRTEALTALLPFCTHDDKRIRQSTIQQVRKWYLDVDALNDRILAFALQEFQSMARLPTPERLAGRDKQDKQFATAAKAPDSQDTPLSPTAAPNDEATPARMNGEHAVSDEAGSLVATVASPSEPSLQEEKQVIEREVVRRSELFMALCSKRHELLKSLFEVYPQLTPFSQSVFRDHVVELIRSIGMQASSLLDNVLSAPVGAESLAWRILDILTAEALPAPELIAATKQAHSSRDINSRYLLYILPGISSKAELTRLLADGCKDLEKSEADCQLVKRTLRRLLGLPEPDAEASIKPCQVHLSPTELLVAVHNMELVIGIATTLLVLDACYSLATIYTPEALAVTMQQLVHQPTVPSSFMYTLRESIAMDPNLGGFASGLLHTLVTKKVWTMPALWAEFVQGCVALQPMSLPTLLDLPRAQFAEVMTQAPQLQPALVAYVQQLNDHQRQRIQPLLSLLDTPQTPGTD